MTRRQQIATLERQIRGWESKIQWHMARVYGIGGGSLQACDDYARQIRKAQRQIDGIKATTGDKR